MARLFQSLFAGLAVFFVALNWLGGAVAGVWLVVLGEWRPILIGVAIFAASTSILSIALLPSLALGGGAFHSARRSRLVAFLLLGVLSLVYVAALMTVWALGIFGLFMGLATEESWFPLLLWSYGIATGPWSYMASQEVRGGGGEGSAQAAIFGQLAFVAMGITAALFTTSFAALATVFGGVMAIHVALSVVIAIASWDTIVEEFDE